MKVKAGKTTDTQHHLSAKENQEDSWYCYHCCCQCEERLACHLQGYHLCLWGNPIGQSATFSKKTKGWSRNCSFTRTKFWSPQPTSFWCGWPPTRSSCFSTPLFAGSGSWGLLLLLGCEGGAGWRCLDSGELQEDLGRGWPKHWHWPVRHCLQAVVGLLQKLHLAQLNGLTKKSSEINTLLTITILFLLCFSIWFWITKFTTYAGRE